MLMGNYTIAAKQGAILKFSYIGCKPQSVKVTKAQINGANGRRCQYAERGRCYGIRIETRTTW